MTISAYYNTLVRKGELSPKGKKSRGIKRMYQEHLRTEAKMRNTKPYHELSSQDKLLHDIFGQTSEEYWANQRYEAMLMAPADERSTRDILDELEGM